jgi:hypothetical protein
VGGGENSEEDEVGGTGVVSAVDDIDGDMSGVAGLEPAGLSVDPLLRGAFDDVDDLFQGGVAMELVSLAGRHGDPDEHELLSLGEAGSGDPLVRAPGQMFDLDVIALDEPEEFLSRGSHSGWKE